MHKIDITKGIQLDEPNVFIPWDIEEVNLVSLLKKHNLEKITDGYYSLSCISLGGLSHMMGFHFETKFETKRDDIKDQKITEYIESIGTIIRKTDHNYNSKNIGKLRELEFFRKAYPDLKKSFDEFQFYFEKAFGQPSQSEISGNDFLHHEWKFKGIRICHYVLDRFGPEEHLRIKKA
jgi:hypothetical protein